VQQVILDVNASAARVCFPAESRRTPATLADAKYSVPFMTAVALVHGRVDLETAGEGCLSDQTVLALARRIEVRETLPDVPGHPPARLTLTGGAGPRITTTAAADELSLDPGAGLRAKVGACLHSSGAGTQADAAGFIATVAQLCRSAAPGAADRLVSLASGPGGLRQARQEVKGAAHDFDSG
jgi:hypothetical protein